MNKERVIIAALSLVILAGVIIYAANRNTNYSNSIDEYATDSANMKSEEQSSNAVELVGTDGFIVEGKTSLGLVLQNLESNDCNMSVIIDTPEGVLYESPILEPGDKVGNIKLNDQLAANTKHDGKIIYQFLDANNKIIGRAMFEVEIMSI